MLHQRAVWGSAECHRCNLCKTNMSRVNMLAHAQTDVDTNTNAHTRRTHIHKHMMRTQARPPHHVPHALLAGCCWCRFSAVTVATIVLSIGCCACSNMFSNPTDRDRAQRLQAYLDVRCDCISDVLSGGCLCALVGVPCRLRMLSTVSNCSNILLEDKSTPVPRVLKLTPDQGTPTAKLHTKILRFWSLSQRGS